MTRIAAAGFIAAIALSSIAAAPAEARGCFKGAVVGAVVGHYAHHHAILGAIGGCLVARHLANQHDRDVRDAHAHGDAAGRH
ncbi:MAG: hypothetical protein WDN03_03120 [Rhizomicrobium sp.]